MQLHVNLPGYEEIKVELDPQGDLESYQLQCSTATLELFEELLKSGGRRLAQWQLPLLAPTDSLSKSQRRSRLLIAELIQKARGEWRLPYQGTIVCTCRDVSCEVIDQSVLAGADTVEGVSLWTTACTSCTTCKSKIEEIMAHRLGPQDEAETASRFQKAGS